MVAEVLGMPTAMAIGLGANLAVGTANLGMSIKNNMDMQRMARDVLDAKRDMMQVRQNSNNCNMMGYNNNNNNPQMMQMMQTMNQLQQQMQMMQNNNCGNNWGNNNWNENNNWNNTWSNNYPYGNGGNGFPY